MVFCLFKNPPCVLYWVIVEQPSVEFAECILPLLFFLCVCVCVTKPLCMMMLVLGRFYVGQSDLGSKLRTIILPRCLFYNLIQFLLMPGKSARDSKWNNIFKSSLYVINNNTCMNFCPRWPFNLIFQQCLHRRQHLMTFLFPFSGKVPEKYITYHSFLKYYIKDLNTIKII